MSKSPLIGIPQITFKQETYDKYTHAVSSNGGTPVTITPDSSAAERSEFIHKCHGFIFMGGPDFAPERYGGTLHPSMKMLEPAIEDFYFSVATTVIRETAKPVLGICLGCQLINVIMGGTLYEDIHTQVPSCGWHTRQGHAPNLETMHPVAFTPDSPLRLIFGCNTICANSSHHQAIKAIGNNLTIAARADDGIVEAVALKNCFSRFLIGLQWHPERLTETLYPHARIFQALVHAARR
ncbi:MAG: gamma-glutamyl-gamma-aminobutyrate hydrolase family protein [Victivallales bacterium]|nr:gamma-glutamyl-gamma-aminobutyrate hydrolase family protein [Victivallales bacterium]